MAFYMESFSSSYAPAAWVIVRARVCMYACEEDARGADAKRNKVISEMMAEAPNLGVTNNDEILNRIFFCDIRGEKREWRQQDCFGNIWSYKELIHFFYTIGIGIILNINNLRRSFARSKHIFE